MELTAKILLTLATLGYSAIPCIADLNKSHARNPDWTGHARFHVVWQVMSYALIALLGLYLLWFSELGQTGVWIAGIMATCIYLGFFIAVLSRPSYAGKLFDENGYPPYTKNLFKMGIEGDINVTIFTIMSAILIAGAVLFIGAVQ